MSILQMRKLWLWKLNIMLVIKEVGGRELTLGSQWFVFNTNQWKLELMLPGPPRSSPWVHLGLDLT